MAELYEVFPDISADHDEEMYHIEIELPGIKKEDIDLEMTETALCIKAPKGDMSYNACYTLAHTIDVSKVSTTFENGLLTILAPFQHSLRSTKISIG